MFIYSIATICSMGFCFIGQYMKKDTLVLYIYSKIFMENRRF